MGEPGEPVGDPVCWLHQLCPECGAMPSEEERPTADPPTRCWRCGAPRTPSPPGAE